MHVWTIFSFEKDYALRTVCFWSQRFKSRAEQSPSSSLLVLLQNSKTTTFFASTCFIVTSKNHREKSFDGIKFVEMICCRYRCWNKWSWWGVFFFSWPYRSWTLWRAWQHTWRIHAAMEFSDFFVRLVLLRLYVLKYILSKPSTSWSTH